ncbi:pyridoxamine 5'-phosphate oxidase family protein [Micromonospora sp. CPCC 206060]|uniref:pyridoxamine 5'-phosphate oxidase family protein n=1 Tax=Micromonospora sp. CPCC 206060 TaxID=3122406 RepID=UPI002FEFCD59
MTSPPRTFRQRRQDTLHRLEHDVDAWVATADPATGIPYLVPLSFLWDGEVLLVSTAAATPTSRNLRANPRTRLGIGPTRDLVLIEATVETVLAAADIPQERGDAFAAKTGFDPRRLSAAYLYFGLRPQRLQAWREVNEIDGRDLMHNGGWLDDTH